MIIENLNKENFWNELHKKYPEAVDHFCKWIDNYKKEVGWDKLFNVGTHNHHIMGHDPKFHDLPFEMQNGIIARYELELYNNAEGKGKESYQKIAKDYRSQVENIFIDLQSNIQKRQKKLN